VKYPHRDQSMGVFFNI